MIATLASAIKPRSVVPASAARAGAFASVLMALLALFGTARKTAAAEKIADEEQALIRAIVEGYKDHRERFPVFQCRFKFSHGDAANWDDAMAARMISEKNWPRRYSGLWLRDHDRGLYTLTAEQPPESYPVAGNQGVLVGASESYLRDGEFAANYLPEFGRVVISGAELDPREYGMNNTPFSMGMFGRDEKENPHDAVQEGLKTQQCRYEGKRDVDGRSVEIVLVSKSDPNSEFVCTWRYFFDPARGFLPVRIECDLVDQTIFAMMLEFKEFPGARWFPMRVVRIDMWKDPQKRPQAMLIETTHVTVDDPADPSALALDIPANTRYAYNQRYRATLDEPHHIGLGDLPKLAELLVARQRSTQPPVAGAPGTSWLRRSLVASNIAVLVVVAIVLARWRKRRLRSVAGT